MSDGPVYTLEADSPITFPETGALPATWPPDRPSAARSTPEEGYFLFGNPERSLTQIREIQAAMPSGTFAAPEPDWTHLPRARRLLTSGGDFHLLGLGDSIVNDTMRSGWLALLRETYPSAKIRGTVYVRGGGGCQHYREEDRVAKWLVPRQPDVVYLGGISQQDVDSVEAVIHQLREGLPTVEIFLASGTFGRVDPRDPAAVAAAKHSGTGEWGRKLKELAGRLGCAYLDMTGPWADYLRSSGVHPHCFYRDRVHANEFGEQVLAKILMAFWGTA